MKEKALKDRVILIKGAGEMASGVACRLFRANFRRILMLETPSPLAVRRRVSFCEAVPEGTQTVEGIEAIRVSEDAEIFKQWDEGKIAVRVDPEGLSVPRFEPDVLVDAIIAKRNLGTRMEDVPLVVALGPGFEAGKDCHVVVETNRGHDLGRIFTSGKAEENTGIPGDIAGYTRERVQRSPDDGVFTTEMRIGDRIRKGEMIGRVAGSGVTASIDGILRGLIRPGTYVTRGLKIGDIDPRGDLSCCDTISEKARSLGGAVLEAVLSTYNH